MEMGGVWTRRDFHQQRVVSDFDPAAEADGHAISDENTG